MRALFTRVSIGMQNEYYHRDIESRYAILAIDTPRLTAFFKWHEINAKKKAEGNMYAETPIYARDIDYDSGPLFSGISVLISLSN